ncbi:MAG: CAP domain-containing protein [Saprospiraceae bacterium]|nr:CAP domain-containing protein [Saprospiraceae bacterium]
MRKIYVVLLFTIPVWIFGQSLNDQFLTKINDLRSHGCYCGDPVGRLTFNSLLRESAFAYAKEMAQNGYFSHTDRSGGNVARRVDATGYRWLSVGENLAINQDNIAEVFEDWLNSPEHCWMMMDGRFLEMGLARYENTWVLHMGRPEE